VITPIAVERVSDSRLATVDLSTVPFSSVMSDHMLVAEYAGGAWAAPTIRPYGPLSLSPAISALQYGVSIFEGLKAHRLPNGRVALFRPAANAARFNQSAARMAMPAVPESMFVDGLRALVALDQRWVPPHGLGALYIRPCLFSTDDSLRVKPAERFVLTVFTCPYSAYYAAPVDVLVTDRFVRAFPGGTGAIKPAGNYAPALLADAQARDFGCQTVLWLDAREYRYVEECGVMNVFFALGDEVATPALSGTILPGITRDSVLALLRDAGHRVRERRIALHELVDAHDAGMLHEAFGTGTAATVAHIRSIRVDDRVLMLPPVEGRAIGPRVRDRLVAIATGAAPDLHGWIDALDTTPAIREVTT
jgi:branched-chain amino acid aminotransferase